MTYSIVTVPAGVTYLSIRGSFDDAALSLARPELESLLSGGPRRILLDVSGLRYIDTSGVGMLIRMYKRCRASGGTFMVSGLLGQPLAILKLLRLDRLVAGSETDLQ
jgi:anti-sigma B factor antagonist